MEIEAGQAEPQRRATKSTVKQNGGRQDLDNDGAPPSSAAIAIVAQL